MPLPIAAPPPAWEMFIPPSESPGPVAGWLDSPVHAPLAQALLRPFVPLLGLAGVPSRENFFSGLQAEKVLGTGILPTTRLRQVPLVWIGVALRGAERLFESLSAGCWVCGFPAVGRGRELLRLGNLADAPGLTAALGELTPTTSSTAKLYFNFHYDEPEAAGERVYILDAGASRLYGFAFPRSALAPANLK